MFTEFESEIHIRPDDIDMNNHVHNTKYLDYVLAARYEQMRRDYKMSMDEFHRLDFNWVVSTSHIEYKRALKLEDIKVLVRTKLESYNGAQSKVSFRIVKLNGKTAAEGYLVYTMVSLTSGRPVRIPEEVIKKYTI